jgi:hypothetical protein
MIGGACDGLVSSRLYYLPYRNLANLDIVTGHLNVTSVSMSTESYLHEQLPSATI